MIPIDILLIQVYVMNKFVMISCYIVSHQTNYDSILMDIIQYDIDHWYNTNLYDNALNCIIFYYKIGYHLAPY